MKIQPLLIIALFTFCLGFTAWGQQEAEVRHDGIIFPRLAVYPLTPDLGQVIYYIPSTKFEYWDGVQWQPMDSSIGGPGNNMIIDDVDNNSYVRVLENAISDIIQIQVEGSQIAQFHKNFGGTGRLEFHGNQNTCVGDDAGLNRMAPGQFNVDIGTNAGKSNSTGNRNVNVGSSSGELNLLGSNNTNIGTSAGYMNTGSQNTFVGDNAGRTNTGSGNVFLGYEAGKDIVGSNKLYIENSDSLVPLIYGDFVEDEVFINRDYSISTQEKFGISAEAPNPTNYGGMYVETTGSSQSRPFYGFAINNVAQSYTYHNGATDEYVIYNGADRLKISNTGILEINNQYHLPNVDGAAGQVLVTDGAGQTSWGNAVLELSDLDGDTKVEAIENGSSDYIKMTAEGSSGEVQIRKNPGGDIIVELVNAGGNTLVGDNAGDAITTSGDQNTLVGAVAGSNISSGDYNTAVGHFAGLATTTGSGNCYFGKSAGQASTGSYNTVIGYNAALNGTMGENTIIGNDALKFMDNNTTQVVVVGREAGESADLASYSVLMGYQAGQLINDGYNVMIGYQAGQNQNNTNQVMKDNVCIGYQAGQENDGNRNVYIGKQCGLNNQGDGNVFIGNNVGSIPTAVSNQLRIANQNENINEPLIFGEFDNRRLGINTDNLFEATFQVDSEVGDDLMRLRMGTSTQFMVHDDGTVSLGSSSKPTYRFQLPNSVILNSGHARATSWATYSDRRVKTDITRMDDGIQKIMQLNPVSYNQHASTFEEGQLHVEQEEYIPTIGFLAQELQTTIPEAVVEPDDESTSLWSVNYEKIIPVLTKAIQEQQELIVSLQDQLAKTNAATVLLESRVAELTQAEVTISK